MITPDQAKASLGLATHLQNMLLPQQQAQATAQTQNPAPDAPTNQESPSDTANQMQGLETRIMDEIGTLKEEIKKVASAKDASKDIEDLKKQIEQVLNSND